MQVTPQVALGPFTVGFVTSVTHDLTCALLFPALRSPIQNSSETASEGQDAVTWPSQPWGPRQLLSQCTVSGARSATISQITELFCIALEDLGNSFSFLSLELPWRSIGWSPGARPPTWNKLWMSPWPRGRPCSLQGTKPVWMEGNSPGTAQKSVPVLHAVPTPLGDSDTHFLFV